MEWDRAGLLVAEPGPKQAGEVVALSKILLLKPRTVGQAALKL